MEEVQTRRKGIWVRLMNVGTIAWQALQYTLDRTLDDLTRDWVIIRREIDLFLGATLFLIGLFGFESGRYCDGNIGDYISCTRPATYYYFDSLDIVLIILGLFFALFWYFKHKERARTPANKQASH